MERYLSGEIEREGWEIRLAPVSPIAYGGCAMDIFFADDARQRTPTRPGMGPLVAAGGIYVPGDAVRSLERDLTDLCTAFGFPLGEEFKWSPRPGSWMHGELITERRQEFLIDAVRLAAARNVSAVVIIEDTNCDTATPACARHEDDATALMLERVNWCLRRKETDGIIAGGTDGIIIADRPGGARRDEDKFLANCLESIQSTTLYLRPTRIALNVLSTSSHLIRLLQLADVVCSCTTAVVAGEASFSPPIFEHIRPLLHSDSGRIGGVGLKLHPDFRYANLYHWLLGDAYLTRGNTGRPLPDQRYPYSTSPVVP